MKKTNVPAIAVALFCAILMNLFFAADAFAVDGGQIVITTENFLEYYEMVPNEYPIKLSGGGAEIYPELKLSYRLKPEVADAVDVGNSHMEVTVRGNYVLRGITSVDWSTGKMTFLDVTSADLIVSLQRISLANGNAQLANRFSRLLYQSAEGVAEIEVPLNRLADGAFRFRSGMKGPICPLTKEDYVDEGIFVTELQDLSIVSAHGILQMSGGSKLPEDPVAAPAADQADSGGEIDEAIFLEYLPKEDGSCVITRYARAGEVMTVPESLDGYAVSEIGDYAFAYCESLKSVRLPAGITRIGTDAFYGCSNLESINLPIAVREIENGAFGDCIRLTITVEQGSYAEQYCEEQNLYYQHPRGTNPDNASTKDEDFVLTIQADGTMELSHYNGSAKQLTVPPVIDGWPITAIADHAFEDARGLLSVTLSEGLVSIGKFAFAGTGPSFVTLPSSLKTIGSSAFNSCTNLVSIEIPEGVTEISDFTFYFCVKLSEVTLPESLTSIDRNAFGICSSLKSLRIPANVSYIHEDAFGSSDLTLLVVQGSYAEQYCREHGLAYKYTQ